jgi:hypothetical protein
MYACGLDKLESVLEAKNCQDRGKNLLAPMSQLAYVVPL